MGGAKQSGMKAHFARIAACLIAVLMLPTGAQSALALGSRSRPLDLTHRLVFVRRSLSEDRHVEEIRRIVEHSSRLGFNGIVLSSGFDAIGVLGDDFRRRLREVRAICEEHSTTLIPLLFSVGYGGALAYDRNLAAAAPLKDVPFVVDKGRGVFIADAAVAIANGGFERTEGHKVLGFDLQDGPGLVSFHDAVEHEAGGSSLRLENFSAVRNGMGRVMQEIRVHPFRCYRVGLWVKTEGLAPAGAFRVLVMAPDSRVIMELSPPLGPTGDWRELVLGFNSLDCEEVRVYVGVWRGAAGRVWIDDIRVEEVGPINVVRRPGTPVRVRNADTGVVYSEGEDIRRIEDSVLSYKLDHEGPALVALPTGRIRDGDRLLVDCYQALSMKHGAGQVSVCMSEPRVFEIWEETARLIHETIAPDYYFLSMDEVRQGGWCEACRSRGLSAGEIIGDCITRQCEIIRGVNPGAGIFVWSDMLDPNHNARGKYYAFNGDFTGSWEHVPNDLIIACWRYDTRDRSLRHFDERGFKTIACGYYDRDDEGAVEGWIASLRKTAGSCGIVYTTWRDGYTFLDTFAAVAGLNGNFR
jgi:hypothetical protein